MSNKARLNFLLTKMRISMKTLAWLFSKPRYVTLAIVISLLLFEFVYWMFNLSMLGMLITSSSLNFSDKLSLFTGPFVYVQNQNGPIVFGMMAGLAIAQGLTLAALIYAIRHQPKTDSRLLGGGIFLSLLALVGLGCPACGTSLITPIVAVFVSGTTVAASERIAAITLPLAFAISVYGLYAIGLRTSAVKAWQPEEE